MEFKEVSERLRQVTQMVEEIVDEAKKTGSPGPEAVLLVFFHMQLTEQLKRIADIAESDVKKTESKGIKLSDILPDPSLPTDN